MKTFLRILAWLPLLPFGVLFGLVALCLWVAALSLSILGFAVDGRWEWPHELLD